MELDVRSSGSIPSGDDIFNAIEVGTEEAAQRGVNMVQAQLGQVLRNPSGFYRRHIVTERRVEGFAVTDSKVVYGPWLEGTGRRNSRSRFKGYRTFRQIGQRLEHDAAGIVQDRVDRELT